MEDVAKQNGKEPRVIRTKLWSAVMLAFATWSLTNRTRALLHPHASSQGWAFLNFGLPQKIETAINLAFYGWIAYTIVALWILTKRYDERILMVCAFGGVFYRALLFAIWPDSIAAYYVEFVVALAAWFAAVSLILYIWKHKVSANSAPTL